MAHIWGWLTHNCRICTRGEGGECKISGSAKSGGADCAAASYCITCISNHPRVTHLCHSHSKETQDPISHIWQFSHRASRSVWSPWSVCSIRLVWSFRFVYSDPSRNWHNSHFARISVLSSAPLDGCSVLFISNCLLYWVQCRAGL